MRIIRMRRSLVAFVMVTACIVVGTAGCGPANRDDQISAGATTPLATALALNSEDVLILLKEFNTSVESFRVVERQVNSGVRDSVPWMKTDKTMREYQAPDRTRTTFYATEYVRDLDGDGAFEDEVSGESSCETQEAVTIAATFYERCDDGEWTVTPLSRDYSLPVQNADDLLIVKVHELEELRLLPQEVIDGRDMYVFQGTMPSLPDDIYEATRTVWVDEETALLRRIVEIVQWEEPTGDEPPDTVATEEYLDYNSVTIIQPDLEQANTS